MQLNRIEAVRGYIAPHRIAVRSTVVAPNRAQRQFTVVRANQGLGHREHPGRAG